MALNDESKSFYKSLVTIVIPIVIQNFITAAVGSTDVIMLSFVSQTALAAVSLANQIQFLLTMIFTAFLAKLRRKIRFRGSSRFLLIYFILTEKQCAAVLIQERRYAQPTKTPQSLLSKRFPA